MKPKIRIASSFPKTSKLSASLMITTAMMFQISQTNAADRLWSSSGGSAWLTASNWTGGIPTASDVGQFGVNPTATSGVGINFSNTTNAGTQTNGNRIQELQAIEILSTRTNNHLVGNSSGTAGATGKLRLLGGTVNSVSNVILRSNSAGNLTIQNTQGSGNQTMDLWLGNNTENKIVVDSTGNIVISSIIVSSSGSTPLTIMGSGSGRVDITSTANTFTGDISITGAEVRFTADGSMGNAANDIIIDGGRFAKASDATTVTLGAGRSISVGDAAGTSISSPGSGTLIYNNAIANKTGETGSWAKQGGGTLELGGVSTYTGSTAINNGILKLTTGNDRLPTGTVVSLGQAASTNLGTLDLNGRNQTIAGLASTSGSNTGSSTNVVTSATTATLTIDSATDNIYSAGTAANSGVISGAISLVKSGNGIQTLGGTNTYTGTTTIKAGTLALSGSGTLGTGNVILDGGILSITGITASSYTLSTTQTLSGSGDINSTAKSLLINGTLAPGASAGVIDVTGSVTLGAVSVSNFEISGDTAGEFDQFNMTGTFTMNGTLNLITTGTYLPGDFVQLFSATTFNGAFTTINGTDIGGGLEWDTSTLASNGIITVIPEPSVVGLLGLSAAALLRRRKR